MRVPVGEDGDVLRGKGDGWRNGQIGLGGEKFGT